MTARYRWQDRRQADKQINHVVDLSANQELCHDIDDGETEVIQGLQGLGGDYYCVACLRRLVAPDG